MPQKFNLFHKFTSWYFSKGALPYWCVLVIDWLIVMFAGYVAHYLCVGGMGFTHTFWQYGFGLLQLSLIYIIFYRLRRTYTGIIRYSSFVDLGHVAIAVLMAAVVGYAAIMLANHAGVSASIQLYPTPLEQLMIACSAILLMWVERIIVKMLYEQVRTKGNSLRTFIYGTKDGGVSLAKAIRSQNPVIYNLKGFVCPDCGEHFKGMPERLLGAPVYKDDAALLETIADRHIAVLLISPLQAEHFREQETLIDGLIKQGVKIMMLPTEQEWDGKSDLRLQSLHDVDIEDLLPREKIEVDLDAIGRMLCGTTVLVTGAAGSIGYEMARQIAKFKPQHLIMVDQAETPMHTARLHMAKHYPDLHCETIVSSITNQTKMEAIFAEYKPDYVFHAAAYKHVPMMENNPAEAVQNNVYGTRVIADLAVKYGTKKFVMISTDKAVNPTNVMGCSKRICEIYCQALNAEIVKINHAPEGLSSESNESSIKSTENTEVHGKLRQFDGSLPVTQFITTRFGNVLGSNGSVIPIFKKQIEQGGPVTVTHKDIIRFFMLIPEACRLVLHAGTMGNGGEIYVFDMGKPVRIADLAQRMIDLSGAHDLVHIEFTGLRDGEKLFEEVLAEAEQTKPTTHPKVMVASVREYPYDLALKNEIELYDLSFTYDDMAIVKKMKEIVPEFKSRHSKYEALD